MFPSSSSALSQCRHRKADRPAGKGRAANDPTAPVNYRFIPRLSIIGKRPRNRVIQKTISILTNPPNHSIIHSFMEEVS